MSTNIKFQNYFPQITKYIWKCKLFVFIFAPHKHKSMTCSPITEDQKKVWIEFMEDIVKILDGQQEVMIENKIFHAAEGDVSTSKLLAGHLLATIKNEIVVIK